MENKGLEDVASLLPEKSQIAKQSNAVMWVLKAVAYLMALDFMVW